MTVATISWRRKGGANGEGSSSGGAMFALDVAYWCVTVFSLLTLVCSISFLAYFSIGKTFKILFTVSSPEPYRRLARSDMRVASLGVRITAE